MAANETSFNSETGAAAGAKSRRKPFDERMREWLQQQHPTEKGLTNEEVLRRALMEQGQIGNVMAAREILNRSYGQAKQHMELSGKIDIPAVMIVIDGKVKDG